MNLPNASVIWSNSALAHCKSRRYSTRYIELIIANPQSLEQQSAYMWVVKGYGMGVILAKRGTKLVVVTCFRTDTEAKHRAAV